MSAGFQGPARGSEADHRAGQIYVGLESSGQTYGSFLRSDRAHAEIVSINTEPALASPGVLAVLTGADTAKAGFKSTPQLARYPGRGGATIQGPHRDGLANGRVRFVGQEVALVVAKTAFAAQDAVEKIDVEYHDLPAVIDAEAALAAGCRAALSGNRRQSLLRLRVRRRGESPRSLFAGRPRHAHRSGQPAHGRKIRWSPRPVLPRTTRRRTSTICT